MRGANILFNLVTFVFVVLTLGVLLYIFAIAGGRLDPPLLAPPTDVPTPTLIPDTGEVLPTPFLPTFTPSHTPEPSASPELSPTPTLTTTPPPALAPTNLPLAPVDPARRRRGWRAGRYRAGCSRERGAGRAPWL